MNKGLWIARKNHLFCIIKKLSDIYGGDDAEWLKRHYLELLDKHEGEDIELIISVYEKILDEDVHHVVVWKKLR